MDNNKKQEFTRRLTQCNKGELIIIMYDIAFAYIDEAKVAYEQKNQEDFKTAIRKAQSSIDALSNALDFKYEVSKDLHQLYVHSKNLLAKAMYQNKTDAIEEAEKVLKGLYASFSETAKTDTSGPLMRNTQKVYAGYTYGRTSINESVLNDNHRGFFV